VRNWEECPIEVHRPRGNSARGKFYEECMIFKSLQSILCAAMLPLFATTNGSAKAHHFSRQVSVRNGRDEKAKKFVSEVTLDFTGMSAAEVEELASRPVIIEWQRVQRAAIDENKPVPPKATIKVKEFMAETHSTGGGKLTAQRVIANADKIAEDPKAAAALIAALQKAVKANK
jgi:hypothetical protein